MRRWGVAEKYMAVVQDTLIWRDWTNLRLKHHSLHQGFWSKTETDRHHRSQLSADPRTLQGSPVVSAHRCWPEASSVKCCITYENKMTANWSSTVNCYQAGKKTFVFLFFPIFFELWNQELWNLAAGFQPNNRSSLMDFGTGTNNFQT